MASNDATHGIEELAGCQGDASDLDACCIGLTGVREECAEGCQKFMISSTCKRALQVAKKLLT
jgi:hypothetical protein